MTDKNIVDIDEKAPQLKAMRKKRANRRFILYITILFFLILLIIYFESPYSDVQSVEVYGNDIVDDDWVKETSGLLENVNIWGLGEAEVLHQLEENESIADASLERSLPVGVNIHIEEYSRVAYMHQEDNSYIPVLESGARIMEADPTNTPGDVPILRDFEEEDRVTAIAEQLAETNETVESRISEIHFDPQDGDPSGVMVYMNDGFTVRSTITSFHERMDPYPAIVEQLEGDEEGIIHMRLNPYFESFEEDEEEDEDEEGQDGDDEAEEDLYDDGEDVIENGEEGE